MAGSPDSMEPIHPPEHPRYKTPNMDQGGVDSKACKVNQPLGPMGSLRMLLDSSDIYCSTEQ